MAKGTGTPRQATTSVENLLNMMGDRGSAMTLEGMGVQVYQRNAKGEMNNEGRTRALSEVLPDLLRKYKANPFVVGSAMPAIEKDLKTLVPTLDAQGNSP